MKTQSQHAPVIEVCLTIALRVQISLLSIGCREKVHLHTVELLVSASYTWVSESKDHVSALYTALYVLLSSYSVRKESIASLDYLEAPITKAYSLTRVVVLVKDQVTRHRIENMINSHTSSLDLPQHDTDLGGTTTTITVITFVEFEAREAAQLQYVISGDVAAARAAYADAGGVGNFSHMWESTAPQVTRRKKASMSSSDRAASIALCCVVIFGSLALALYVLLTHPLNLADVETAKAAEEHELSSLSSSQPSSLDDDNVVEYEEEVALE